MNRDGVITLLKEICTTSKNISPDSVVLTIPNPNDKLSTGYRVLLTSIDQESKQQISGIIHNYNLSLFDNKGEIVSYKPKKFSQLL